MSSFDTACYSPVMPFGKHRGARLAAIGADYLRWLVAQPGVQLRWAWLYLAVQAELQRRDQADEERRQAALMIDDEPEPPGRVVYGAALTGAEVLLLDRAESTGCLTVPLWLPASSPLPDVWACFCQERGWPCRVHRITAEECWPDLYTRRNRNV
jgi:hypothetical protein